MQLYEVLYTSAWTLLAFSGRGRRADPNATATAVARLDRPDLRSFLVNTLGSAPGFPVPVLDDLHDEIHRICGLRRPTLVLVRPDGHIGARVHTHTVDRLRGYLQRWLPDARQQFTPHDAAAGLGPGGLSVAPRRHTANAGECAVEGVLGGVTHPSSDGSHRQ